MLSAFKFKAHAKHSFVAVKSDCRALHCGGCSVPPNLKAFAVAGRTDYEVPSGFQHDDLAWHVSTTQVSGRGRLRAARCPSYFRTGRSFGMRLRTKSASGERVHKVAGFVRCAGSFCLCSWIGLLARIARDPSTFHRVVNKVNVQSIRVFGVCSRSVL